MSTNLEVQALRLDGDGDYVVLKRADYEALLARAGDPDAEDAMTARIVRETNDLHAYPEEVFERIEAGEHPVKVFREHRRLTQVELARRSRVSQAMVSGIEAGQRVGSPHTLRDLAKTLGVNMEDLLEQEDYREHVQAGTKGPGFQKSIPSDLRRSSED